MKTSFGKSGSEFKRHVLAELEYEPSVNIMDMGVLVKDGTVTLNGYAKSYGEKWNGVSEADSAIATHTTNLIPPILGRDRVSVFTLCMTPKL
jgi:hypothetical protein